MCSTNSRMDNYKVFSFYFIRHRIQVFFNNPNEDVVHARYNFLKRNNFNFIAKNSQDFVILYLILVF